MPAKDKFHDVVKKALEKESWQITHDPLPLQVDGMSDMYIDLGAEKLIAAQRNHEKIAVEIKSFLATSAISEFHTAIGQYINYRYALEEQEAERILYLAVPLNTYQSFFKRQFIQTVIQRSKVNILVYNIEKEELEEWKLN